MKITKRQLRRIIREEKKRVLKEKKGLWANIHAKRKRGERPAKPGEKGYPKTLDIDESEDHNDDNKNDFEDVKIARMKASGMSDSEIKKKHPELFEMKITKRQLRRIIREERKKLSRMNLKEAHSMDSVKELDDIRISISDIAVGVYQNDPELAKDLEMQVERLEILHDKLKRSLAQGGRTPTEAESGIPDHKRSVIHNRRPDW